MLLKELLKLNAPFSTLPEIEETLLFNQLRELEIEEVVKSTGISKSKRTEDTGSFNWTATSTVASNNDKNVIWPERAKSNPDSVEFNTTLIESSKNGHAT